MGKTYLVWARRVKDQPWCRQQTINELSPYLQVQDGTLQGKHVPLPAGEKRLIQGGKGNNWVEDR